MRLLLCGILTLGCSASTTASNGGGDASTRTDTSVVGKDGGVTEEDSSTPTDSGTSKPDTAPSMRVCQMTCSVPGDCTQGSAAFDGDNYTCESGVCRYRGCNSDAECISTFMTDKYACRDVGGLRQCMTKCSVANDCATAGSAAYDADNWTCDAGTCRYLGCKADSECSALGAGYVCRKTGSLLIPICQKSCTAASDCATASAAYDEDNYACESGVCTYIGCKSDEECRSSLMKPNYACR